MAEKTCKYSTIYSWTDPNDTPPTNSEYLGSCYRTNLYGLKKKEEKKRRPSQLPFSLSGTALASLSGPSTRFKRQRFWQVDVTSSGFANLSLTAGHTRTGPFSPLFTRRIISMSMYVVVSSATLFLL